MTKLRLVQVVPVSALGLLPGLKVDSRSKLNVPYHPDIHRDIIQDLLTLQTFSQN